MPLPTKLAKLEKLPSSRTTKGEQTSWRRGPAGGPVWAILCPHNVTSDLVWKTDICKDGRHVRFAPISLKNAATVKLPASPMLIQTMSLHCWEWFEHCGNDQLGELVKVLGGGCEQEFVFGSGRTAQPQPSQADDAF